ncbi:MAG TPA: argininosuccinate synthase [Nitrososphaerales archaeon]
MRKKIALAYSGGLDTSVALKWLQEKYDSDIVTVTLDIGQLENINEIEEKSRKTGGIKHYTINAEKEFVENYIFPSIKANGLYEGKYPLGTALARPLIAAKLVEIAEKEGCFAIAHGCTGKGNDQVRFDVTAKALNPKLKVIAPVREWNLSRDQEIEYAKSRNIEVSPRKTIFSIDQNLWGRSIESGPLEDLNVEPPEEAFEWCKSLNETPSEPGYIELEFKRGIPIAVNGKEMNGVDLISEVNLLAGAHGIGIIDHIEDRLVGIKSREVYEAPGAVTIIEAHRDIEKLVLTRNQINFKTIVEQQWTWLVYAGLWIEPLKIDLDKFLNSTQKYVTGKVRMKLFKGNLRVVGRSSPFSLYDKNLATYNSDSTFVQNDAIGFINLWGLPSIVGFKGSLEEKN